MILIQNTYSTEKPEITEEEDRPFPSSPVNSENGDMSPQSIPDIIKLNDQKHSHDVDNFKNTTGKHILYGCLIAMAFAAIADSIWHIDSPLLTSAFEVSKIVATTILGYFFGSKAK